MNDYAGRINCRIEPRLYEKLQEIAAHERRSLRAQVELFLDEAAKTWQAVQDLERELGNRVKEDGQ